MLLPLLYLELQLENSGLVFVKRLPFLLGLLLAEFGRLALQFQLNGVEPIGLEISSSPSAGSE